MLPNRGPRGRGTGLAGRSVLIQYIGVSWFALRLSHDVRQTHITIWQHRLPYQGFRVYRSSLYQYIPTRYVDQHISMHAYQVVRRTVRMLVCTHIPHCGMHCPHTGTPPHHLTGYCTYVLIHTHTHTEGGHAHTKDLVPHHISHAVHTYTSKDVAGQRGWEGGGEVRDARWYPHPPGVCTPTPHGYTLLHRFL
mgnify:CR=1 FL=1